MLLFLLWQQPLMTRNMSGWGMALLGPWLVWLMFAHGIRPFAHSEFPYAAALVLAYGVGILGAYFIDRPFSGWPFPTQLTCFALYAIGLAVAMPMIALVSICTTGDCL